MGAHLAQDLLCPGGVEAGWIRVHPVNAADGEVPVLGADAERPGQDRCCRRRAVQLLLAIGVAQGLPMGYLDLGRLRAFVAGLHGGLLRPRAGAGKGG